MNVSVAWRRRVAKQQLPTIATVPLTASPTTNAAASTNDKTAEIDMSAVLYDYISASDSFVVGAHFARADRDRLASIGRSHRYT